MRWALLVAVAAACTHGHVEIPTAPPGRTLSIYMPAQAPDPQVVAAEETIRERVIEDGGDPGPAPTRADAALGYVDDRRWIELAPGADLVLSDLPPAADLDSLIVEPLGEAGPGALSIAQCTRAPTLVGALADLSHASGLVGRAVDVRTSDGAVQRGTVKAVDQGGLWLDADHRSVRVDAARIASLRVAGGDDPVRCAAHGAPGRHLVRIAYASAGVAWKAVHRVEVAIGTDGASGTATVRTGFEIDAPGWTGDAEIALWRGLPGEGDPPERVWNGSAGLGDAVTVWSAPKTVPAHLVSIFRGAMVSPSDSPTDPYWRQQSVGDVFTWLALDAPLPAGDALVSVTVGGGPVRIAKGALAPVATAARMALWADPDLRGLRQKTYQSGDEHGMREHLAFSVTNLSDHPRAVWIEEELRPAKRRKVLHAKPAAAVDDGVLRVQVTIPAGGLERAAADVVYDL
jgi:hypothetical protein